MKLKKLLVAGILCALILPLTASAHVSFKRTEKEDNFKFKINAGETVQRQILLLNTKDEEIDAEIYATDGTLTSNGAFTVLSKNDERKALGEWIKFTGETVIHLEGKEEKLLTFTISVPETITPGVYGGGLSASPVIPPSETSTSGAGAIVSTRVVQPIYVEVPGTKISDYSWNTFSFSNTKEKNFHFHFENKGNTIIKIKGNIEITDLFGNKATVPVNEVTLLQGSEANSKAEWKEQPFFGLYTAKAHLTFSELDVSRNDFIEIETRTKELTFNIIPWTYVFLFLAFVLALIGFYIARKGAEKKFLQSCQKYTVQENDTIKSIATHHNINWQKLAKINSMEAPYELTKGQVILVPPKE